MLWPVIAVLSAVMMVIVAIVIVFALLLVHVIIVGKDQVNVRVQVNAVASVKNN
jgi:hypothetical protein